MCENLSTLAEMKRTVIENIIPNGSRITVKIRGVWDKDIIVHSRRKVL